MRPVAAPVEHRRGPQRLIGPRPGNQFLAHIRETGAIRQVARVFADRLAQRWGGPIEVIRAGDVVWFPPGEKSWHGATPTTAMTHIAIQEQLDGKAVDWMEQVSDEQYQPGKNNE